VEGIPSQGVAAKHIIAMKFSIEAIVAATVAVVFVLLTLGAIAREQGDRTPGGAGAYVTTSSAGLSQVAAGETDVLGFY